MLFRSDWGVALAAVPALGDVRPWRLAVILELNDSGARIGLQPGREKSGEVSSDRETGALSAEGMRWTGRNPKSAFTVGDVIYVEPFNRPLVLLNKEVTPLLTLMTTLFLLVFQVVNLSNR